VELRTNEEEPNRSQSKCAPPKSSHCLSVPSPTNLIIIAILEASASVETETLYNSMERTVALFEDPDAGELSKNHPPDEKHRINITDREIGDCVVTGRLKGVHYGTFSGKPAALILFRFEFLFNGSPPFRYTSAKVKISLASTQEGARPGSAETEPGPIIAGFHPKQFFGGVTKETVRTTLGVSAPPTIMGDLLPVKAAPNYKRESTFERSHCVTIRGIARSSYGRQDDVAMWKIEENRADQSGIPPGFSCGIIVLRPEGEFNAQVDLHFHAKTRWDPRLWFLKGSPWTKDDPINFDGSDPKGLAPLTELECLDLSKVTKEIWESILAKISGT